MSWPKVAALCTGLVAFIALSTALAPQPLAGAAGAWLLSAALILVVPLDRR